MTLDTLDQITLILLLCLVAVALLFPLSAGRSAARKQQRAAGLEPQAARRQH